MEVLERKMAVIFGTDYHKEKFNISNSASDMYQAVPLKGLSSGIISSASWKCQACPGQSVIGKVSFLGTFIMLSRVQEVESSGDWNSINTTVVVGGISEGKCFFFVR